jgi:hypothetical protein
MPASALDFDAAIEPLRFIGRRDVLESVFDRLNRKDLLSSSIVGGPKTGKTSLLRYIVSTDADRFCPPSLRLYVDAEPLGGRASSFDFWITALRAAQRQAPSPELSKTLARAKEGSLDVYDLEDLFDHYAEARKPIVIVIDNFETLIQNDAFWPPSSFFHDARSLAQRVPRGVAYITGTMRPLLDLWDPSRAASPYYNIFANILVGRMTDEDIGVIVHQVFTAAGVMPSREVLELVTAASDHHPGLVGHVAQFLAERLAKQEPADEESLVAMAENPIGPYISLARQIRTSLQPGERQLIDSLGQQPLTESNRLIFIQLKQYGLLPPGTEY